MCEQRLNIYFLYSRSRAKIINKILTNIHWQSLVEFLRPPANLPGREMHRCEGVRMDNIHLEVRDEFLKEETTHKVLEFCDMIFMSQCLCVVFIL